MPESLWNELMNILKALWGGEVRKESTLFWFWWKLELHCPDFQSNLTPKWSQYRTQLSHAFASKPVECSNTAGFSSWSNKAKGNRIRDIGVSYETSINALACPLVLCSWLQNGAESFLRLPPLRPPGQDRTPKKTQAEFDRRQHDLSGGTPQQSMSPGDVRPGLSLVLRSVKKYNVLEVVWGFFLKKIPPLFSEFSLHLIIIVFQLCCRKSQTQTKSKAWN